jgi:hypothetical protein
MPTLVDLVKTRMDPRIHTAVVCFCGGPFPPPLVCAPPGGPRVSSDAWHRLGCLLRGTTRPRLCTPVVACISQVLVCLLRAPPTGGTDSASRTRGGLGSGSEGGVAWVLRASRLLMPQKARPDAHIQMRQGLPTAKAGRQKSNRLRARAPRRRTTRRGRGRGGAAHTTGWALGTT